MRKATSFLFAVATGLWALLLGGGRPPGSMAMPAAQVQPPADTPLPPAPTATAGPSPTASLTITPLATPTADADGRIIYVAQPGDSYIGIAERFGVPVANIYALNNLTPESPLFVGQQLILAIVAGAQGGQSSAEFPGAQIQDDGTAVYTVVEGDTLALIAARFDLTLDALFALNPTLGLNTLLLPGRGVIVGRVPVPSQVGGSTDQASPEPTASITPTPRPSETPPAQPSPSAAVATSALGTQAPGEASENTGIDAAGLPRLVAIFGVGIGLLAAVGVALVWLSRPR